MGAVVGGWGALIVLFAVVSTVGITVTQRETEIGLLRTIGATPRQASRLVRAETLLVAIVASAAGAALATLGGRALLAMLRDHDVVAGSVAVRRGGGPGRDRAAHRAGQPGRLRRSPRAGRPADRPRVAPSEGQPDRDRLRPVAGRRGRAAGRLRRWPWAS